ncbi:MAG: DUF3604 domain-containing protein [Myxococcota bacterium]|nr:DUF3604 domain-containing protein [Myxococcota bacterium]
MSHVVRSAMLVLLSTSLALPGLAKTERPYEISEEREACASYEPLRRPLFGDTHVHTAYSFDASVQDTRNTPRDAYRFARGERLGIQPYDREGNAARSAQLRRPLDWTAVSDHAELLGEVRSCNDPNAPGYDSDICWLYQTMRPLVLGPLALRTLLMKQRMGFCGEDGEVCRGNARAAWSDIQSAAEEAYDRTADCRFTSFVGYEWTGTAGNGFNLHRNVIFRNEKVPELPANWVDSRSAFHHWQQLQEQCVEGRPGCDALTIPHNSNLGGDGLIFATAKLATPADLDGPVDREEAELRQRWEPIVEIMQHKGDSECLLGGDTVDEACGFEKVPYDSFAGATISESVQSADMPLEDPSAPKRSATVREALKKGLALEQKLGANPLKFGIIASTDTHLGTPGLVDETNSKGHGGAGMAAGTGLAAGLPDNIEYNPGGLAVVWAEENARDSIFAALQRRETYGTSGPRHVVRFFGGWSLEDSMCSDGDFAKLGYQLGVPMGGDLSERGDAQAPRFAVSALADPGADDRPGAALQRIQIVKGWVDGAGAVHEKVFDVAGGDNGADVDTRTCERRGTGAQSLCSVWSDPEFDASQGAFYYARVLENPSCRWSQHLCIAAGVDCSDPATITQGFEPCCAADHRPTVQERAWTSPIWYQP